MEFASAPLPVGHNAGIEDMGNWVDFLHYWQSGGHGDGGSMGVLPCWRHQSPQLTGRKIKSYASGSHSAAQRSIGPTVSPPARVTSSLSEGRNGRFPLAGELSVSCRGSIIARPGACSSHWPQICRDRGAWAAAHGRAITNVCVLQVEGVDGRSALGKPLGFFTSFGR